MIKLPLNKLVNGLFYLTVLILLIPTQILRAEWYFLEYGPIIIMFFSAILLSLCMIIYVLTERSATINIYTLLIFLLWLVLTISLNGLVFIGYWESLSEIGKKVLSGTSQYFLAFMSLIIISLFKWREIEFETFLKGLLLICFLWGIESFLSYYFGYKIPYLLSISEDASFFQSGFSTNLNIVSKISIIGFWGSLYFYFKQKKKEYIILALMTLLVVYSTETKIAIGSIFISFSLFLLLINFIFRGKVSRRGLLIFFVSIFLMAALLVATMNTFDKRDPSNSSEGGKISFQTDGNLMKNTIASIIVQSSVDRVFQYSRATEVFLSNPIGYGAGIGYLMGFSKEVDQHMTLAIKNWKPMQEWTSQFGGGWLNMNLQQETVRKGYSIHNAYLNYIVDYGIFALLLIYVYLLYIFKALKLLTKMKKYGLPEKKIKMFMALIFLHINILIALQTASNQKFFALWVIFVLWMFLFRKTKKYEKLIQTKVLDISFQKK